MFLHSIPEEEIATQVAGLLNSFNGLNAPKTARSLMKSSATYLVETQGRFVIGAVGVDRQGYNFTEIKHLVVHPDHRGKGIAKYLAGRAMLVADTKMLYATVREGNDASLGLFRSLGFVEADGYEAEDHRVTLLVRAKPPWEKAAPFWRSSSSRLANSSPFRQTSRRVLAREATDTALQCLERLGIPKERL